MAKRVAKGFWLAGSLGASGPDPRVGSRRPLRVDASLTGPGSSPSRPFFLLPPHLEWKGAGVGRLTSLTGFFIIRKIPEGVPGSLVQRHSLGQRG